MHTLKKLTSDRINLPMGIAWQISDLMEYKGRQELFTRQAPQRLKALREHAIIESAVSSNRIEGVEVDRKRIKTLVFGSTEHLDRNEEEVSGYRTALQLIHEKGANFSLSEKNILKLHQLSRGEIWDAGKYKDKPIDIIETMPTGKQRIRFKSVLPENTPTMLRETLSLADDILKEKRIPPLLTLAALNLDFLCVHPFRDGNGRVSRLFLLQSCYQIGFEVGRYISLERIIEKHKERYYETLETSSQSWHQGKHEPWPYIGYLLFILKNAYKEFEERIGKLAAPRGEKTAIIQLALKKYDSTFSVADLQRDCPGVSIDMIRHTLKRLKNQDKITCKRRGRHAKWENIN